MSETMTSVLGLVVGKRAKFGRDFSLVPPKAEFRDRPLLLYPDVDYSSRHSYSPVWQPILTSYDSYPGVKTGVSIITPGCKSKLTLFQIYR